MGHASSPLGFTPPRHCRWSHRFDDPDRKFRTLYTAEQKLTCLREVLAPLKPSATLLARFREVMNHPGVRLAGAVSRKWLSRRVLACGRLEILDGNLIDLDDLSVRGELEIRHAALLKEFSLDHLNFSELRGPKRKVTQALARDLFRQKACGIVYGSNVDGLGCVALFEGRFRLELVERVPLLSSPDLREVMEQLGLVMAP